jgi:hypothetical protein
MMMIPGASYQGGYGHIERKTAPQLHSDSHRGTLHHWRKLALQVANRSLQRFLQRSLIANSATRE